MRLFVAFKLCPDLELLREEDIVMSKEMGMDTHFLPNIINCYDESALELALRLRDKSKEQESELTAFTLGNEQAELTLKSLRALGYHHTIRAKDEEGTMKFSPETVASTMVSYLRDIPQDCILIGKEAPVGNHGIMAQLVANELNIPFIGPVIDILSFQKNSVTVMVSDDGKILEQTVTCPCVLCVGNAVISKLRVATLRERMKVGKTQSEYIDLAISKQDCIQSPVELQQIHTRRSCFQSCKTGEEAVEEVMKSGLQKVLERL